MTRRTNVICLGQRKTRHSTRYLHAFLFTYLHCLRDNSFKSSFVTKCNSCKTCVLTQIRIDKIRSNNLHCIAHHNNLITLKKRIRGFTKSIGNIIRCISTYMPKHGHRLVFSNVYSKPILTMERR
jgi:hypothetical protein